MTNLQTLTSLYRYESSKKGLLLRALLIMEEYYTEEFTVNQTVKMIFNGLLPLIPLDATSHRIFEYVLIKFKKDPHHDYDYLERGLREIFAQRI
jgi:AcrR family transcriptional regulator